MRETIMIKAANLRLAPRNDKEVGGIEKYFVGFGILPDETDVVDS